MRKKVIIPILMSAVLVLTSFAGCVSKGKDSTGEVSGVTQKVTDKEAEPITLPISKEKITLSFFSMPPPFVGSKMKGQGEMEVNIEAEKRTNIAIKWREESYTDPKPKLNLMFSTGEPEDIIWDAFNANGGAKKLLDDEMIVPLNDYIEKYAPNLKRLLKENPELLKQISTDDGRIFMFPEIRLDPVTRSNSGFQIRKDWLDKFKLQPPTNINEWYTVLKTFRENDANENGEKDEIPFVSLSRRKSSQSFTNFASGFGILDGFFISKGQVKYAPLEKEYKDYISTLAKWYKEGLIDQEYATQEAKNFDAKITGNKGGSYYGALSGNLGTYLSTMKKINPNFDLQGLQNPKSSDGIAYASSSAFTNMAPHGASIGKNNKYVVETVKWLDWHYSDEGHILYNWGIEGKSFSGGSKTRKFTDLILKNPDGLSLEEADARYAGGVLVQMPVINDPATFLQLKAATPQQKAATDAWGTQDLSLIVPTLFFDEVKTQENTNIMSEVNTYLDEMFNKFVMGLEPLSNYDKFVQKLKDMKIEQVLKNYQESYDKSKK